MKPDPDRFTIFVVCDGNGHTKPQGVTNFVRTDDENARGERWEEHFTGRSKHGGDSAVNLVDNARPTADELFGDFDQDYWARARPVFELQCRKCRKVFEWRGERLFAAFDALHDAYLRSHGPVGVLPISLRAIAATVESLPQA